MTNKLLKQEEIDALLKPQEPEPYQHTQLESAGVDSTGEQRVTQANGAILVTEQSAMEPALLTDEEKDALGEVGNICMGSSSTTLSLLLNQPVNITSPRVTITTREDLLKDFIIPHMSICVNFTEGLSGYNLLIMKLKDTAILADLMMGGDGTNISEELSEIGVSAASEAMNQMIGAASTAMATLFSRKVNISPPETKIYHNPDELDCPKPDQEVVVWFKMTIGSILDTQIMQVMDMNTAREEAGLILGQLSEAGGEEFLPAKDELTEDGLPDKEEKNGIPPAQHDPAVQKTNFANAIEQQPGTKTISAGPSEEIRPAVTPPVLDKRHLERILDIPLKITVLLGRTKWPIKDILELTPGAVVELQSLVNEPVEVLANGTLVAMGEVVVVNENFGVRLTNIVEPEQRLQNLRK